MKAIWVQHTGGPEVMELVEIPMPQPKPAEAVVKVSVAGVNSIDGHFRDGSLRTPMPFVPGQEGAGVVAAVGAQVKAVKVGDRVAGAGRSAPTQSTWRQQQTAWCRCQTW
jgi:NADPH2:quinone reductase